VFSPYLFCLPDSIYQIVFVQVHFRYSVDKTEHIKDFPSYFKVDAMKLGLKEMKKEYKKVNIDEIEVCLGLL